MPHPFEPMVRPFALPDSSPAQVALGPEAREVSQAPITIFFGKTQHVGGLRIFNGSFQETVTNYADKADVEKAAF